MLTSREKEVFVLLMLNMRMKDIAASLRIDRRTLDTHGTNIYKKMGTDSRIGLILEVLVDRKHDLYLQKNGLYDRMVYADKRSQRDLRNGETPA